MSASLPVEIVKYIGPEHETVVRDRGIDITEFTRTLNFVFQSSIADQLDSPLIRFYVVDAHGSQRPTGEHDITLNDGPTATLDLVMEDLNRRDPQRTVPTVVMINSCYSGKLVHQFPADLAVFTSDANDAVCYHYANLFTALSESLEQVPLLRNTFETDTVYTILLQSRMEGSLWKGLRTRFNLWDEGQDQDQQLEPNSTGYNHTNLSLKLPERSEVELFDQLELLHFSQSGLSLEQHVKPDLPNSLKKR